MEQEVAPSRGGCNSRHALKGSGEMTSMVHIVNQDGGLMLQYTMLSGAPECMDSLPAALELMDS